MSKTLKVKSFQDLIPDHRKKKSLTKHKWDGHTFSRMEDIVHYEAIKYIKLQYPDTVIQSNHLAGKSLKFTGKKFNPILRNVASLNGTKGMPDIIVFERNEMSIGLVLELKKPGGSISEEEKRVIDRLRQQNYSCHVVGNKCADIHEAVSAVKEIIIDYMKGVQF